MAAKTIYRLRMEYDAAPMAARLPTRVAAAGLSLSPLTIERWRSVGKGPQFGRIAGRRIFYTKGDIERWISANDRDADDLLAPPKRAERAAVKPQRITAAPKRAKRPAQAPTKPKARAAARRGA